MYLDISEFLKTLWETKKLQSRPALLINVDICKSYITHSLKIKWMNKSKDKHLLENLLWWESWWLKWSQFLPWAEYARIPDIHTYPVLLCLRILNHSIYLQSFPLCGWLVPIKLTARTCGREKHKQFEVKPIWSRTTVIRFVIPHRIYRLYQAVESSTGSILDHHQYNR